MRKCVKPYNGDRLSIDNAVKFGGSADVQLQDTGDNIAIVVEDEGPGIPDSEIEAVFNPFFRIEASRSRDTGGVGLGLSVAHSIIDAHGGEIILVNRPEGGLRVSIELPGGLDSVKVGYPMTERSVLQ